MKKLTYFILGVFIFYNIAFATDKLIYQKDFENKTIYIDVNSYKILQFNKRIKNIQITNSENIIAEIMETEKNPLTRVKIYAKEASNESSIITFQDDTIINIGFNIVPHLKNLINFIESVYPELKVEQINDTIFLKGNVPNQKDKDKVLEMFTKFDIDPEQKVVDMLSSSNPKMIRIKLYAVEINNDKGLDIKNNWVASSKNYVQVVDGTTYRNVPLDYWSAERNITGYDSFGNPTYGIVSKDSVDDVMNQPIQVIHDELDNMMKNALSLTGGLSGAANFLGKYFNTSLTLQYLADEGIANVLDETTLITLEDKEAVFRAGGEIYVRLVSDEKAKLERIDYGLELTLTAKEVMNDEFVHLNIATKARELDWANQVDSIPAIINKSINTTVIIKNNATVVLGGLVNNKNTKDLEKIPMLGDIPILGFLFKSSSFKEGRSELVFFITPEIVKASTNNQFDTFKANKEKMFEKHKKETKETYLELLNLNFLGDKNTSEEKLDAIEKPIVMEKTKKETSTMKNLFKSPESELTSEQAHQKRVNEILGY